MDLITKRIYEIADVVGGGTPSTSNEEYWGGDIPWLSPADLTGYQSVYISHGEKFITPEGVKKSSTQRLPAGSVLFSSRAPIGYIAIAQNEIYTNQGFKSLVCKSEVINNLYLYYYLKLNLNYIKNFASGATFPELSANRIKNIKITFCKSLHEQQKIASILSAYDSQIENNQKRIKLLEQMAENLYKEWFVRFRFPGYENAEFEGGVPKGWTVDVLGNLFETSSGGTPSRKEPKYFENGTIGWVKTGELLDSFIVETEEKITEDAVKHSAAKMIPVGSLLCSMYAGVGKLGITTTPLTCSQATCVFNPKAGVSNRYLFYYLKLNKKYLENISFGAAQQNISQEIIKKIKMIVPPRDFIQSFDRRIEPLWKDILIIMNQNRYLTTQRDLLLPRLMSGKLSI